MHENKHELHHLELQLESSRFTVTLQIERTRASSHFPTTCHGNSSPPTLCLHYLVIFFRNTSIQFHNNKNKRNSNSPLFLVALEALSSLRLDSPVPPLFEDSSRFHGIERWIKGKRSKCSRSDFHHQNLT